MIKLGRIRLNGRKLSKISSAVKVGDVLTLTRKDEIMVLRVLSWPDRRGSAKNVQEWYEKI